MKPALAVQQVAKILSVSDRTVARRGGKGELPSDRELAFPGQRPRNSNQSAEGRRHFRQGKHSRTQGSGVISRLRSEPVRRSSDPAQLVPEEAVATPLGKVVLDGVHIRVGYLQVPSAVGTHLGIDRNARCVEVKCWPKTNLNVFSEQASQEYRIQNTLWLLFL